MACYNGEFVLEAVLSFIAAARTSRGCRPRSRCVCARQYLSAKGNHEVKRETYCGEHLIALQSGQRLQSSARYARSIKSLIQNPF
jgi:hypothetical protein